MRTVTLTIDNLRVHAPEGSMLLWAALDKGIYIPNLCALRECVVPFAGCRLCFVEIAGYPEPVTACTEPVREGLVVSTHTENVLTLQRTAAELILSAHHVDCGHCGKNKTCELQKIAVHLRMKLKPRRLRSLPRMVPLDTSHPLFTYDPSKCVVCGRCLWVCKEKGKGGVLNFAYRGFDMVVTTFGRAPDADACCYECEQCVAACPVGAIRLNAHDRNGGEYA